MNIEFLNSYFDLLKTDVLDVLKTDVYLYFQKYVAYKLITSLDYFLLPHICGLFRYIFKYLRIICYLIFYERSYKNLFCLLDLKIHKIYFQ